MKLKIYNTLSRSKENFEPLEKGKVRMYVCGPTVYDYIHIGNARPMIVFDVVRKYLQLSGYEVEYIVNFTDVDDKLIRRAEQSGETVPQIADRFIQAFMEDAAALGVAEATAHPRVTGYIAEIIHFIERLIDKGFAYESGGDVYFHTDQFSEYGKLSGQITEQLQAGIRIEVDERKQSPHDFVLWKRAKEGEISWSSPWGQGRPGWHIECSTMARQLLGETIDIHGGGQDLQFPHHECEIAQSEALTGQPFARYWMHNGYIRINNEKMSKSLGNSVTVKDLLAIAKPQAIRYFMLSTQYRNPLNFSDEVLQQSSGSLQRIQLCIANVLHRLNSADDSEIDPVMKQSIEDIDKLFHDKMNDDFNTPDAISALFELVALANRLLEQKHISRATLQRVMDSFTMMNQVLGIVEMAQDELLDDEIEQLIAERTAARQAKDWTRSDEIRDLLAEKNIILEDTPQGVRWRRQ